MHSRIYSTDRQTDRQTDRDRQSERERDRETERQRDRETERQRFLANLLVNRINTEDSQACALLKKTLRQHVNGPFSS